VNLTALTTQQLTQIATTIQVVSSLAGGAASFIAGQKNADRAREEAAINEGRLRRERRILAARAQVAFGASGAQVGTGTPLELLADEAARRESDALLIRRTGAIQAGIFEQQGLLGLSTGFFGASSVLIEAEAKRLQLESEKRQTKAQFGFEEQDETEEEPEFNQ